MRGARPPAGVVVRPAVPGDAERLVALHVDCWDDAYTGLMPQSVLDGFRATAGERVERWRAIAARDATLVAERGDELVGFASHGPGRDADLGGLEVYALYTRAAWWGTGLGATLLAGSIGDRAAYLWVLEGNDRAIAFYEKHGFRLDGGVEDEEEGRHLRMVRAGSSAHGPDRA
jgi:GNAT superfamily N-acetyltransferase